MLGYGISNQSIKRYFDKNNISYVLYDDFIEEYHQNVDLNSFDWIIKSPVIYNDHWLIILANRLKKKIITDLELFYLLNKNKTFITITGTNGKTTTVNLIKCILKDIDLGGNLGIPLFNFIDSNNDIIIEASSFMLEYIEEYHSKFNVILNLSPNHLDHHLNYKNYIRSKLRLLSNLCINDYLIYNADDQLLSRLVKEFDLNLIPFSIKKEVNGAYLKDNYIYYQGKKIINIENINLMGKHNLANICASIAVALNYNPNIVDIENKVKTFNPVEHRIEYLGKIGDVKIYNDSKSTNYKALKIALDAFPNDRLLLICGGRKRSDNIQQLDNSLNQIELVLTNGEDRDIYNNYFQENNISCISFDTLKDLLPNLNNYLNNVSVVLFSPGSPSYDQFKNFEERGKYFKFFFSNKLE